MVRFPTSLSVTQRRLLRYGALSALLLFLTGSLLAAVRSYRRNQAAPSAPLIVALPPRELPEHFPPRTHLPDLPEGVVSGSIDLSSFSPGRDLIRVDDDRVWWESDHDQGGQEDDHTVHTRVEAPFRKLVELVAQRGGTLEVHDAYRPAGVHNATSLHKEGRALDLTCDQFPLETLAKLAWVAGFDWVYYEAKPKSGPHIHCSVKR